MDTKAVSEVDLAAKRAAIRNKMPKVYEAIQRKAAEQGKGVFGLVTRALQGEPDYFFAIEGTHVAGTPFVDHPIRKDVGDIMASCPTVMVCMFGAVHTPAQQGGAHGAH